VVHKQKQLLLVVVLSLVAIPAFAATGDGGAISLVQQTEIGHATATNPTGTFASAQAAGDANVILIEYCGLPGGSGGTAACLGGSDATGPITAVTDTAGNTYTRVCGPVTTISAGSYTNDCGGGTVTVDGYTVWVEAWMATNIKSSSSGNVVTATMTNVDHMTGWNAWLFQLHSASGTIVFDKYVSKQSGTSADPVAGPISTGTTATTTYPNEFFLAYCSTSYGVCPPSLNTPPWIEAGLNGSAYYDTHSDAAYAIATSEQSAGESFTAGSGENEWLGLLVTFGSTGNLPLPPTNLQATVN
jgi:hypothetical protein